MSSPDQECPTIYIVDDDSAVLDSLGLLMKSENLNYATFTSAIDFLDRYPEGQPGCLILDVGIPGMSGLQLQKHLNRIGASLPIIFITGHGDVPMAVQAIQDGAADFLQKPFSNQALLKRVHQALEKSNALTEKLPPTLKDHTNINADEILKTLTKREKEVLECIVEGLSNKATANKLDISQRTVEAHRANIMQKLNARSVAELVRMALLDNEKG